MRTSACLRFKAQRALELGAELHDMYAMWHTYSKPIGTTLMHEPMHV